MGFIRYLGCALLLSVFACSGADADPDVAGTAEHQSEALGQRANDPCATVRCAAGSYCVAKGRTAACEPDPCATVLCLDGYQCVVKGRKKVVCEQIPGETCGDGTCPSGQVCCNDSCGICTEPGGVCIQLFCGESAPL